MPTQAPHRLLWRDRQSNREALEVLAEFRRVELDIAPSFHHALFSQMRPGDEAGHRPEILNVQGGAELLRRAAGINGLAELGELAEAVAEADGRVQILSPSPRLIISLPEGTPQ